MCQTVCIFNAVTFSAEAVRSKSSFEAEAEFRMSISRSYFCDRVKAVVKF